MTVKRRLMVRVLRGTGFAILGFVAVTVTCVLLMRWIDPIASSFIVRDRFIAWQDGDKTFAYRRQWVDLEKISKPMQLAVIASEDQKFPDHFGFDLNQISDALDDRANGRRTRGASTITQQVAKNLFLWPKQSWVRKGIEAYFTMLIEALWPKRRILEVYLNVAEFGPGVYGVETAGRKYFGKSAARLNAYDAALLAAVLPNPKRLKVGAPSAYVRSRQSWIIGQMAGLGGVSYLRGLN